MPAGGNLLDIQRDRHGADLERGRQRLHQRLHPLPMRPGEPSDPAQNDAGDREEDEGQREEDAHHHGQLQKHRLVELEMSEEGHSVVARAVLRKRRRSCDIDRSMERTIAEGWLSSSAMEYAFW